MPTHIIFGNDPWGNNSNNKRVAERLKKETDAADGKVTSTAKQVGTVPAALSTKDPGVAVATLGAPVPQADSVKAIPPTVDGAVATVGTPGGTGFVPKQNATTPVGPTSEGVPNWTPNK